jgi:UDP-glucose:(heptosyl)LPS alpha-1,3-glucosyltransferase
MSDSDQILLFVASGWRRKGLLEAMHALKGFPRLTLLVLGRDNKAPWVKIAKDLGVENQIKFVEARKDINKVYHAADLVILPSWYDSFGFVVLESMACGTPVVVSRFAGAHELVIPRLNGMIIDRPDRIDEMRAAIDEGLKIRPCEALAASVSTYTIEKNVKKTIEVIERAAV